MIVITTQTNVCLGVNMNGNFGGIFTITDKTSHTARDPWLTHKEKQANKPKNIMPILFLNQLQNQQKNAIINTINQQ